MTYDMNVSLEEILNLYNKNHRSREGRQTIEKACKYASSMHSGMTRWTGEDYVMHPMRAARMTAEWGFDSDVIVAALLHDVVEDCQVTISEIEERFGPSISKLVNAVTALSDRDLGGESMTAHQKDLRNDVRHRTDRVYRFLFRKPFLHPVVDHLFVEGQALFDIIFRKSGQALFQPGQKFLFLHVVSSRITNW